MDSIAKRCGPKAEKKKLKVVGDSSKAEKKKGKPVGDSPKDEKKKRKAVRDISKDEKKKKKTPNHVVDDVVDITSQVIAENTKMASSSEDTWDDPRQQLASKALNASLVALEETMKELDGGATQARQVPQLANSQKYLYVYDSIPSIVRDAQLALQCLFLRRMIPALLSQVIPDKVRKKSYTMLEVKRVKANVLLNEDPRDCDVYALKYIECLALGKPFDGLCDKNIPALRIKFVTELFDEDGKELGHRIAQSAPPATEFVIPHLTDSP